MARLTQSTFAGMLRDAVIGALTDEHARHPKQTPYAFAIIVGQVGDLSYALATEQGLRRVAARYFKLGYRYRGGEWEDTGDWTDADHRKALAKWLRWAVPDEGWTYGDFAGRFGIQPALTALWDRGTLGELGDHKLEAFCTDVLASLRGTRAWEEHPELTREGRLILGATDGEDPRNFLRTAARANPHLLVVDLFVEFFQGEDIDEKIERAKR